MKPTDGQHVRHFYYYQFHRSILILQEDNIQNIANKIFMSFNKVSRILNSNGYVV